MSAFYNHSLFAAKENAGVLICASEEAANAAQRYFDEKEIAGIATAIPSDPEADLRPLAARRVIMFKLPKEPQLLERLIGATPASIKEVAGDWDIAAEPNAPENMIELLKKAEIVWPKPEAALGTGLTKLAGPERSATTVQHREIDFVTLMPLVAQHLLGEPSSGTPTEWRYGTNGSLKINLELGTYSDFEKGDSGGLLAFIVRQGMAADQREARRWLEQQGFLASHAVAHVKPQTRIPFKVVDRYQYHDANGTLVFEVERREPKDFRQRRPDGQGGWIHSVKGVTPVPYRLPEMLQSDFASFVFIPEGEKDVDNLRALGLIASCNAGGAGKWPSALTPHHASRHAVLLPDNDQAGRDHAQMVATKLLGTAASVRILELPGLPPKGDASDWIAAGGTREQLLHLANETPPFEDAVSTNPGAPLLAPPAGHPAAAEMDGMAFFDTSVDSYGEPRTKPPPFVLHRVGDMLDHLKPIDWLIKRYLEADSLALLFSESNVGKSMLAIDMACCVATGVPWHGNVTKKGAVFIIAGEGHNGLIRRFKAWEIANGVDLKDAELYFSEKAAKLDDEDSTKAVLEAMRALQKQHGKPRLIVIDTLARNFGNGDENSSQDMGKFIANLDAIKHEFNATILVAHHVGHGDKTRARGSTALKGALDAEYRLERDDEAKVIRFEATKMKDAEFPEPMSFRVEQVKLPLVDDDGNDVNGGVIRPTMHVPKATPGKTGGGKNQQMGMAVLEELEAEHRARVVESGREAGEELVKEDDWRVRLEARSGGKINRRRFPEVKHGLFNAGRIEILTGGYVRTA